MAVRKRRTGDKPRLAPRGDAAGFARIRMWTNAIETAMIERYVGNAPTLRPLAGIVKDTLKGIRKIKPLAMSDCPPYLGHSVDCNCGDPWI